MPCNDADTRAKLIDPAIHRCGWTEDLIRREETAGTVEIINRKGRRRSRGRIDYVLRVKVNVDTQPVALALIEAKKESLPPGHGLDQAKVKELARESKDLAAKEIEDAVYDLQAVNPNKKPVVDTRTPEELMDIIEEKGREVADALAALREGMKV